MSLLYKYFTDFITLAMFHSIQTPSLSINWTDPRKTVFLISDFRYFKSVLLCFLQGCMNNVTFGDSEVGYYETVAGGAGAVSQILSSVLFILIHTSQVKPSLVLSEKRQYRPYMID